MLHGTIPQTQPTVVRFGMQKQPRKCDLNLVQL